MKQSNVIKGTLAVVALVAALVVGVAVHMHSVGSPTAGHSTQNTAKTATETTAKTAEYITACLCSMVLRPVERLVFSPKER